MDRHPHLGVDARTLGRRGGDGELRRDAGASYCIRHENQARLAVLRRPRGSCRDDGLPFDARPRPQPRWQAHGIHAKQLGRLYHSSRPRLQPSATLPGMSTDAGPAITRYDFTGGALRGTHFTLYATCLIHRGDNHLESLPLAAIASLRVAYERDGRRLGWGVVLLIVALVLFAVSGPLAGLAAEGAPELAAPGGRGVGRRR